MSRFPAAWKWAKSSFVHQFCSRPLFDRYSRDGEIIYPYETRVYYAQLKPGG
jgi:hypothetical protein